MDLTVHTAQTTFLGAPTQPRRVRVPDREDVGIVVDPGKNFGSGSVSIYVLGIYFPETGECRFYETKRVTTVEG